MNMRNYYKEIFCYAAVLSPWRRARFCKPRPSASGLGGGRAHMKPKQYMEHNDNQRNVYNWASRSFFPLRDASVSDPGCISLAASCSQLVALGSLLATLCSHLGYTYA